MSHLDEGTLHALLDGELELHEVREIQAHLGSCTACDTRLQAAKDMFGEADRLVASVQFPGSMKVSAGARDTAEEALPSEPAAPPRRERRIQQREVSDEQVPQVVILPEENNWPERRRRWLLAGKWAAVLFVAVGAGFLASEVRKGAEPSVARFERGPAAVVSPEETAGPDSAAAPATPFVGAARESVDAAASALVPTEERYARKAAPAPPAPKPEAPPPEDERADAGRAPAEAARNEDPAVSDEQVGAATQEDIREEAAEALAELDRQRRRDRAAAATAAIDRERRDAPPPVAAAQAPAAASPAPRTLEQRSGIYLRIGLDEAARQLGRPVHVIEGLNAQFMGLVRGRQSPGADDTRPAVRVVYQDSQGRMILLDQQRIRPGQDWPSGATQWTVGEIGLLLHGEAGPEVLRNLRPRVR
jgi:hypothetical protein